MCDATAVISALPPKAAKMVAVEILLADPESLGDDVLESCLYILRERLRTALDAPPAQVRQITPGSGKGPECKFYHLAWSRNASPALAE